MSISSWGFEGLPTAFLLIWDNLAKYRTELSYELWMNIIGCFMNSEANTTVFTKAPFSGRPVLAKKITEKFFYIVLRMIWDILAKSLQRNLCKLLIKINYIRYHCKDVYSGIFENCL